MEHGEDPFTAARKGTAEIGLAVMATTFTILAVFLPVGFMTGHRRPVLQVVRADDRVRGRRCRCSSRSRSTRCCRRGSCATFRPRSACETRIGRVLEAWGRFYDRIDRRYQRVLGWSIRQSVEGDRHRGGRLLREPVDARRHRHRVRAAGRPRPVRGHRRAAAGHVVRAERRDGQRAREAGAGDPRGPAGLLDRRCQRRSRSRPTSGSRRRRSTSASAACQAIKADARQRVAPVPLVKSIVTDPEFMQGAPTAGADQRVPARRRHRRAAAAQRRDRRERSGRCPARSMSTARSKAASRKWWRASTARWPRTSASTSAASRCSCAAWSRVSCRRGCAKATRNTTSACGSRRSSATTFEAIARAPLYSPRGALVRTSDIVTMEPGIGPTNIEREQRRRQAKIGVELVGSAARRRHGRRRRR